jgi:putative transcriptional regulator
MSKAGEKILRGAREALAYAQGARKGYRVHKVKVPDAVDVAAIRARLKLTQRQFADRFGFSVANIRNWEQGIRRPEGSARVLLTVISRDPKAVLRALRAA